MALNNVVILGRMSANAELRATNTGKGVTSFTVAVDNGKDQEPAWLDCVAWDKTAKMICDYFPKGKMIAIEGRLQTRTWEDKKGGKHKSTEIVVGRVSFCGDKDNAQSANNGAAANYGGNATSDFGFADYDGELPF